MGCLFVQSKSVFADNSASSMSLAFDSSVVAGHGICLAVWYNIPGPTDVSGISDTVGTVFGRDIGTLSGSSNYALEFWSGVAAGNGADNVTINFTNSHSIDRLVMHEFSGNATVGMRDQATANGYITDTPVTGSVVTTGDGEYIFAAVIDDSQGSDTLSAGSGYVLRESLGATNFPMGSEDQIQTVAGSITAGFTWTLACDGAIGMVTFKAGAPPAGFVPDEDYQIFVPSRLP
jgi:hypothetical protein